VTRSLPSWPALMTRDSAAAYLDMSPRKLDDLQAQGHVIPVKSHSGKRFARSELDRYVESLPEWGEKSA